MGRKSRRPRKGKPPPPKAATPIAANPEYREAVRLGGLGHYSTAENTLKVLRNRFDDPASRAIIENDLGVLSAVATDQAAARTQFATALLLDPHCKAACDNLAILDRSPAPGDLDDVRLDAHDTAPDVPPRTRVAILSLLFNWPSTGGGTVHTAEAGKFLGRAGYDVQHIYACYPDWGVGRVTTPTGVPSVCIHFESHSWNPATIRHRFREALDAFQPDYVIITDSWNSKPLLAEAARGYRYFLRLAALECLCPLNNVRLLVDADGNAIACPRHQLATPDVCQRCVSMNQHSSGSLHQAERALVGFGTREYDAALRRAFAEAEGVLVVNPLIESMVAPFCNAVCVVPSGFDPERFPWPWPNVKPSEEHRTRLFFAGLVEEWMKGFRVLHEACTLLWEKRQDFELVATSEPVCPIDPFTRFIGWHSQDDLPGQIRQADMLIFPTIAQEALGRSAVEAMAVGRPVIASRIGGLPFTVTDGLTGLLFEPGNVADLANKIEMLLDNPALRDQMGNAGRRRFESEFTWDAIIDKHYRRILQPILLKTPTK